MKIPIEKIREYILSKKKEILFIFLFIILGFLAVITSIPGGFQPNSLIMIEEGTSLKEIAENLKENSLIRSKTVFTTFLVIQGKDDRLVAGEYLFHEPTSVFEIARRLTKGEYGIESKSVTLSEGLTLSQMSNILEDKFPRFNKEQFEIETFGFEGYYFPDTYIFPENADTFLITQTLSETFEAKIEEINEIIDSSEHSLDEIVVMASIIEKEATKAARQEVSNILWKRIEINMPLQVDAPFVYERGKGTFDLTKADLGEDSPYNTYVNLGLPPTAIANPGLEAIKAAAHPQPTDNLFFLTGWDGKMYYAEDHEGHIRNRNLHLNQ